MCQYLPKEYYCAYTQWIGAVSIILTIEDFSIESFVHLYTAYHIIASTAYMALQV